MRGIKFSQHNQTRNITSPNAALVLSEGYVKKILKEYFAYYHHDRNHLSLDKDAPYKRAVQDKPKAGKLVELPRVRRITSQV